MEKLDVTIAVAGVVILAVAVLGSTVTGVRGGTAYALTFPLEEEALSAASDTVDGSGTATFTFDVAGFNVSRVAFTVSASSDVPHPSADDLVLTVEAPDGTTYEGEDGRVTVDVTPPPADTEVRAASAEDAVRSGPAPSTLGTGTWTLTVDLTHPDPVPAPHTVTAGGSVHRWTASV